MSIEVNKNEWDSTKSEFKPETEVPNNYRTIINALKKECFVYCNYNSMLLEEKEDRFDFIFNKRVELSLRYTFENQNLIILLILPIKNGQNYYKNPIIYNIVSGIKLNTFEGEGLKFFDNVLSVVRPLNSGKKLSFKKKKHLLIEIAALVAMRTYYEKLLENETRDYFQILMN